MFVNHALLAIHHIIHEMERRGNEDVGSDHDVVNTLNRDENVFIVRQGKSFSVCGPKNCLKCKSRKACKLEMRVLIN